MSNQATLPPRDQFTLNLDVTIKNEGCPPITKGIACGFSDDYDFSKSIGHANLLNIGGTAVNFLLNPTGLKGKYGFMGAIPPTPVVVDGQTIILFRIILILYPGGEKTAAIMFNEEGRASRQQPTGHRTMQRTLLNRK